MKFLFDLFPVILFFAAFRISEKDPDAASTFLTNLLGTPLADPKQAPILVATVVVIAATLLQILWVRVRHGKVEKMLWFSLALVVVFGGLTLFFQNDNFIKWKPTILYWAFATSIGTAATFFRRNAMRGMLEGQIQLPDPVWARLNMAWMGFFLVMGALNLLVAFNFPTETWVNFKLFGGMGLMLVFVLLQGVYLSRYLEEPK